MKSPIGTVLTFGLMSLLAALLIIGAGLLDFRISPSSAAAGEESKGLPPLVIDRDAPLLLDEGAKPSRKPGEKLADNSACYVCHENYREEELVSLHAHEEIGCVDCHGDSFAHRNDENNITPPDIMYPAKKIDQSCRECHETHDVRPKGVIARFLERCPEKKDFRLVYCTDCHGAHRLKSRTVEWDKKTGKLIESD